MPLTAWKHTERNRHRDRKKVLRDWLSKFETGLDIIIGIVRKV